MTASLAPFDAATLRHLADRAIGRGWRCLSVHPDGPAVPRWLAQQVGAAGSVVAVVTSAADADWARGAPGVEVIEGDLTRDELPTSAFDLVHVRQVLVDLPSRALALDRVIAAARPGGVVVVEELDHLLAPLACPDRNGSAERRANRIRDGVLDRLADRGADLTLGRKLPRLLRDHGLVDVAADAYLAVGGPDAARVELDLVHRFGPDVVVHGDVAADEVADHVAALRDGQLVVATPTLVSAWGRRPGPPVRP